MAGYGEMAGAAMQFLGGITTFIGALQKGSGPDYEPFDWTASVDKALAYNQRSLPEIEALATEVDRFNQQQKIAQLESVVPGYMQKQAKVGDIIGSELRGELPPDVLAQMQRSSAAYGVGSGTLGSEFSGYRGLRNLGLSSLELQNKGISAFDIWTRNTSAVATAPLFDVTKMMVDPWRSAEMGQHEHENQFQVKWTKWAMPNALQQAGQAMAGVGGSTAGMFSLFGGGNQQSSMLGGGGGGAGGIGAMSSGWDGTSFGPG